MPIKLITGVPGAGKTLLALQTLLKELGIDPAGLSLEGIKAALRAQTKRPVCVIGVEGLVPGLFDTREDPYGWQDLEDGTLVLVDEAWKWFGSHELNRKQDDRVLKLAEHRHRGFDFILTCQQPSQLLAFLRGLVGEHVHVTRKFGTATSVVYSWPHLVDDPNGMGYKDRATESVWTQPKAIFDLYQSATLHTIKRKIPWKIWAGAAAGVLAIGGAVAALYSVSTLFDKTATAAPATAGAPVAGFPRKSARDSDSEMTAEQWTRAHEPVIAGIPWSAPVFQGAQVTTSPDLLCVSSQEPDGSHQSCRCYTEQATPQAMPTALCLTYARHGVYNPYRAVGRPQPPVEQSSEPEPSRAAVGVPGDPKVIGTGREGDMWGNDPNGTGPGV